VTDEKKVEEKKVDGESEIKEEGGGEKDPEARR
jgi:hypothetical protein